MINKKFRLEIPENIHKGFVKYHGWLLEYDGMEIERIRFGDSDPVVFFDDNCVSVPSCWISEIKETKVLNVDELIYQAYGLLDNGEREYPKLKKLVDATDKNSQLKQWRNHEALRNVIEDFINLDSLPDLRFWQECLKNQLKNLKPLKAE